MTSVKALRLLMMFICGFHLVAGAGLMFSVGFQKFAVEVYGANLPWNDQSIGTMAYAAAKDPLRYSMVIVGFIEFFVLRNIHRHLFSNELITGFGISNRTNDLTTVFFGIQAILLATLLWRAKRAPGV